MTKQILAQYLAATLRDLNKQKTLSYFVRGGRYEDSKIIDKYKVEYYDDDGYLTILIWNPDRPCMQMILDPEDNDATITDILYSPKCTIYGDMTQGEGTRGMITFAIDLLKENGAKMIHLSDNSSIVCKDGTKIRLGPMYFLRNGVTWYEKYFGFEPDEKYVKMYENAKKKRLDLLDVKFLNLQKCEYFKDDIISELFQKIGLQFQFISWVKHL